MRLPLKVTLAATLFLLVGGLIYLTFFTFTLGNSLNLITERGYFIPKESSISTFEVTSWNEGSGEWWIYGKDKNNFYSILGVKSAGDYLVIPRKPVEGTSGFNSLEYSTWPKKFVTISSMKAEQGAAPNP